MPPSSYFGPANDIVPVNGLPSLQLAVTTATTAPSAVVCGIDGAIGVTDKIKLGGGGCGSGAEQDTVALEVLHVQTQLLPLCVTDEAFPKEQKLEVGFVAVITPAANPHTGSGFANAAKL